jgi:hypothetical protein
VRISIRPGYVKRVEEQVEIILSRMSLIKLRSIGKTIDIYMCIFNISWICFSEFEREILLLKNTEFDCRRY